MVIACPFCREASPDMLEEWRGQGFCSACGRSWHIEQSAKAADIPPDAETPEVAEKRELRSHFLDTARAHAHARVRRF
jgi:hypothetical protein